MRLDQLNFHHLFYFWRVAKTGHLTQAATEPLGVKPRDAERSKNFFALGLISWMYTRPVQPTLDWIDQRFGSRPQVRDANVAAFRQLRMPREFLIIITSNGVIASMLALPFAEALAGAMIPYPIVTTIMKTPVAIAATILLIRASLVMGTGVPQGI